MFYFSSVDINNANRCNLIMLLTRIISLSLLALFTTKISFSETFILNVGDDYELIVDGESFDVKGVAGELYLEKLKHFGANTIRTWSIDKEVLDQAHSNGLKVIAGIRNQHTRHGYNYEDKSFIEDQREKVENLVKDFRNHPALLAWGLGNEVELHVPEEQLELIWNEMNVLAEIVKSADPKHPIVTAVAGFDEKKIKAIKKHYPLLDILGVNAYGFSHRVGELLKEYNWHKPYMITEFGPIGPWEVGDSKTSWQAPLEETSHEKAKRYRLAHEIAMKEKPKQCLGTFPFYWGFKQETTTTWFGMLLPGGGHLEAVDTMSEAWLGKLPSNRVPEIHSINSSAKLKKITKNSIHKASVKVIDHEHDKLSSNWVIMRESEEESAGGDFEETPESFPELILENQGDNIVFRAPSEKGAYRLFVYIQDTNKGSATANFPFYVK